MSRIKKVKEYIAKLIVLLFGTVFLYEVFVFAKCWTPECFSQPFHPDVALTVFGFVLFVWALHFLIIKDHE